MAAALSTALPPQVASVAKQVGLSANFFDSEQVIATLSGGEKVKLQLARLLLDDPDILLLDEPTNDIDLPTLQWLEGFINRCGKPILYVSHDETLIENTANVIIHLEQIVHKSKPRCTVARMRYKEYISKRSRSLEHQEQIAQKQRDEYQIQMDKWRKIHDRVEYEQDTISRQDPGGARLLKKKMKAVKSQEKRFEREKKDFAEFPITEEAMLFRFADGIKIPAAKAVLRFSLPVLEIDHRTLAKNIQLDVTGPEHVGIIGRNGVGKTTLLRLIAEQLSTHSGLKTAYMPQNYTDLLPPDETPIEFLSRDYGKEEQTKIRTQMGSMRFTKEEMNGKISQLSGGQKAKLLFLQMTLYDAQVLILDEPTRNFSPLSNPVIRQVLAGFGGAIISVTHDRKYLAEVCTAVYQLTPDGLVRLREDPAQTAI